MSYLAIGLVSSFSATPLNIYLVETLNAEPQMQNTIGILQSLPWSLKLVFGFISDAVPIYGMHRKPYLTMGALLFSFSYITYALSPTHDIVLLAICIFIGTIGLIVLDVITDTMCVERSRFEADFHKGQMQATCYSIRFGGALLGAVFGTAVSNKNSWGWGLTFSQVAFINGLIPFVLVTPWLFVLREKYHKTIHQVDKNHNYVLNDTRHTNMNGSLRNSIDSPIVKKADSKVVSEVDNNHIQLTYLPIQSQSYQNNETCTTGNHLYQSFPIITKDSFDNGNELTLEVTLTADDDANNEIHPIVLQLNEIWNTVQLRSIWRPMAFVYIFNIMQVPNVAWQSYLQLSLHFEPWVLGLTVILGSFMSFAGVLAYKYFFFKTTWRSIYVWSSSLIGFFSLLQILLIFQINIKYLHLSNYLFSMGDDVISAYISGIQFLPLCVMYMRLCPEGSEGASYAMLTTFSNIAVICASNVGNYLASIWDVSNSAMRNHNISGLWKLTLLTSILEFLPLSMLWLLPKNHEEQEQLAASKEKSVIGPFLVTKDGIKPTLEVLKHKQRIGILFSAHWCPPCRSFTPKLKKFYDTLKEVDKEYLEIVMVSTDNNEDEFIEYFKEQPWVAMPYAEVPLKQAVTRQFNVTGIPHLVILDGYTGEIKDPIGRKTLTSKKYDMNEVLTTWL
eukprot:gene19522-25419_t